MTWRASLNALLLALACSQGVLAQDAGASPTAVTVGAGDTATALAQKLRPEGATLEQTLVALWRANPRAFGNGSLNQLLQGATLKVPSTQEILRIPTAQAHELVVEQVEHFQAFARQQNRPAASSASAPSPAAPTLDATQWRRALAEAQALKEALERQSRDTQARLAQLEKNIQTLQGLQPATSTNPAASAASEPASQAASADAQPAASAPVWSQQPVAEASQPLQTSTAPSQPAIPLWAWWAGVAVVVVLMWLLTRRRSSPAASKPATMEIPPQMARISLDLDSPPSGAGGKQDFRP